MTILYEKVGRKYISVQDTFAIDGLTNGSWLVTIEKGLTKVRRPVDDEAGLQLLAACTRWITEWLAKALIELSAYQYGHGNKPLSAKERKAYKAYQNIMGEKHAMWMTKPSAQGVADKVCKKLLEKLTVK